MKAHEYPLAYTVAKAQGLVPRGADILTWTTGVLKNFGRSPPLIFTSRPGGTKANTLDAAWQARAECNWVIEDRPYYTIYPVAQEALAKVKLDLPSNLVRLPRPTLLVRFIEGHEPLCNGKPLCSILAASLKVNNADGVPTTGICFWCDFNETISVDGYTLPFLSFMAAPTSDNLSVEEGFEMAKAGIAAGDLHTDTESLSQALRYLVAVCLLGEDSELVDPDVLDKDRLKWEETHDPLIVDRAHRRGKVGWIVGANIEHMPHLRRPHFGLRWTGEGKKIPKIVPISGSIVHRKKMTEIPEGYLGDRV